MIEEHASVVAAEHLISSTLEDDLVLLDLNSGTYYGLNHVGARIWSMIQKPVQVREIERVLLQEYEVQPAVFRRDLMALLQSMQAENLIYIEHETDTEVSTPLAGRAVPGP